MNGRPSDPISAGPESSLSAQPPPSVSPALVRTEDLTLTFGNRTALDRLSLEIGQGQLFGLLGPNGSGKSTLLRILATLLRPRSGRAEVDGLDIMADSAGVRYRLGVVFQSPGLDGKLTVTENLRFQGYLYGISGRGLSGRIASLLERFDLSERRRERVETLSGGLKRRVELAKAMLHRPKLLLLDEPSTGLDLAARRAFWQTMSELQSETGLTVMLATHLMEEADRCGQVALLDQGRLVALDAPEKLKRMLGETVITIDTADPRSLAARIAERAGIQAIVRDGRVRLSEAADPALAPRLMEWFPGEITSLRIGRPTLGDVFLARTGHAIGAPEPDGENGEASP